MTTVDGFRDHVYGALRRRLAAEVRPPEHEPSWAPAGVALVVVGVLLSGLLTWALRDPAPGRTPGLALPAAGRPAATTVTGPASPDPAPGAGGRPEGHGSAPGADPADGPQGVPQPPGVTVPTTLSPAGVAPGGGDRRGSTVPDGPAPPAWSDPVPDPGSDPTTVPRAAPPPATEPPATAPPPARRCLGLTGPATMFEGGSATYTLQFDQAVPVDVTYRVSVVPGTAGWVGPRPGLASQDIMWGGYYTTWTFVPPQGWVRTGQVDGRVASYQVSPTPTYTDRPMVGPGDASWDWSLVLDGEIQAHPWVDVTVPAGAVRSGDFQVQAWKEQMTVDLRGAAGSYAEAGERFGLSGGGCSVTVGVVDASTYSFVNAF